MYKIEKMPPSIEIGYTGETGIRTIEIDMSAWMEKNPDAVPCIVHIRPGEAESDAYVAGTDFDDNILSWTIQDTDLGTAEGEGQAQIWLVETVDETVTMKRTSKTVRTKVRRAIPIPEEDDT